MGPCLTVQIWSTTVLATPARAGAGAGTAALSKIGTATVTARTLMPQPRLMSSAGPIHGRDADCGEVLASQLAHPLLMNMILPLEVCAPRGGGERSFGITCGKDSKMISLKLKATARGGTNTRELKRHFVSFRVTMSSGNGTSHAAPLAIILKTMRKKASLFFVKVALPPTTNSVLVREPRESTS